MSINTTNYNLLKPADNESADISVINANMDIIDTTMKGLDSNKEAILKTVTEKTSLVDADSFPLLDSADSSKTKKITFTNIKSALKTYFDALYNKTVIANNLTTTTAGNALDATKGKDLADSIAAVNTSLSNQSKAQNISVSSTTQSLYGVANVDSALQKLKNYNVVIITSSKTWTVPSGVLVIDVFVAAAGGGGGGGSGYGTYWTAGGGAGGGGGECLFFDDFKVTPGNSYAVVIGTGGAGGVIGADTSRGGTGGTGGNASFGTLVAYGGTGGVGGYYNATDFNGGTGTGGGGAGGVQTSSTVVNGGAGGAGSNLSGGTNTTYGMGGLSTKKCIGYCPINGLTYGAGGGGGAVADANAGAGGIVNTNGGNGAANRAGGGGGGGNGWNSVAAGTGGTGGSGVVVIGYYA